MCFSTWELLKKKPSVSSTFPTAHLSYQPASKSSALPNEGADRLKRELSISTPYERKGKKKHI